MMQIQIKGKHRAVPAPIKEFAAQKLGHLAKYLSTLDRLEVEIYQDGKPRTGGGHVVDVVAATTGPVFRARAVSSDPKRSIEIAYERLERQVKEFKRRRSGRPAHSRPKVQSSDMVKGAQTGKAPKD